MILVRDALENAFRVAYRERNIKKVSLPALVQTQVEGGGPLFAFDYYGEAAFLTQSSQLYLETVLPSLGDVYCIEKSFRAEKSLTRRHVSPSCFVFQSDHLGQKSMICGYFQYVGYFFRLINQTSRLFLTICHKLAEYSHNEAELDFITFDNLLDHISTSYAASLALFLRIRLRATA